MSNSHVEFHKLCLRVGLVKMRAGSPECDPVHFDRMMKDFGLTPEDVGATAEEVDAAKRSWRVAWAKKGLIAMAVGNDAFPPSSFDSMMMGLGLTLQDIGKTADEVADAKQSWRIAQAKHVLNEIAAGSHPYSPRYFDELMNRFELVPQDLGITEAQVADAKQIWRITQAKRLLIFMAEGQPACGPEYFDSVMTEYGLSPEDIGATADQIKSVKAMWAATQAR
jgi:hypothetical protein